SSREKHGASRLLEEPTRASRRNSLVPRTFACNHFDLVESFRIVPCPKSTIEQGNRRGEFRSEWWPGVNTPPPGNTTTIVKVARRSQVDSQGERRKVSKSGWLGRFARNLTCGTSMSWRPRSRRLAILGLFAL